MKKILFTLFILVFAIFFILNFSGCSKLKVSNLSANKHLKEGNKFYVQEKFKKASDEYEKALEMNPELKVAYLYLGTSYSSLYKPGKTTDRNKEYGEKAVKYLHLAEEFQPDNDDVVIALGNMYDKLGNFEEAEKYFLKILEKSKDDPKAYYTLANFYAQNQKFKKAEEMYKKRIELDPENSTAYYFLASYLQNYRAWDKAIDAHKKRIICMTNPALLKYYKKIDEIRSGIQRVSDIEKYIRNVEKNKAIPAEQKKELLASKKEELKKYPSLKEAMKQIEDIQKELDALMAQEEQKMINLSPEEKMKLAEAYYSLGVVYWNKSYQTPVDEAILPKAEREAAIKNGFKVLEMAIKLAPEYPNPYSYMGLLWREMIKINPSKSSEYIAKNKEFNKKFKDIYIKKRKKEAYKKQLEELEKQ